MAKGRATPRVVKVLLDHHYIWCEERFGPLTTTTIPRDEMKRAVEQCLEAGATPEQIRQVMKLEMELGRPMTPRQIFTEIRRRMGGSTGYTDFLIDNLDEMTRRRRPFMEDGWRRNERDGLVAIIERLQRTGLTDARIWLRLCMWVKHRAADPMLATPLLRMVTDEQEDLIVDRMEWDEIERRVFAWGQVTP